jgi:abhydrolase domain-containing protein 1/3
VLPGITSSSQENYVTHFVDEAIKTGCSAVVMNYRGISIDLATPRTYCATNFDDLDMVVQHIHNKYSDRKIIAVGISMGGIKLGGYLAKQFDDCLISNAMIVSAPMNGMLTINELEKLHNFFTLNILLARCLKEYFSRHKHWFKDDKRFDCSAIARSLSIRDFDSQFITKVLVYTYYK